MIQILKDSFRFFKSNFFKILTIYVPIFITQLVVSFFIELLPSSNLAALLIFIFNISLGSIYFSAIIFLFNGVLSGKNTPAKECLFKGLLIAPLVLYTDMIALLITGGGLLLLIIPGIIIGAKLSLSSFNLILSNDKPIEAIKNSYAMTKGYTKTIVGSIAIVGIPYFILMVILRVLLKTKMDFIISEFTIGIVSDLFSIFFTIILFRIYCLINQQSSIA